MKNFVFILTFCLFSASWHEAKAQRKSPYEYGSEFIWGFNKNTSGGLIGGAIFRKSKRINDFKKFTMYESFGLEIVNIKHAKEFRRSSSRTGSPFIYGKTNYLISLRPQYGRELILFNKASQQGVEIKLNLAAGPSIGLLIPYYVEVAFDQSGNLNSYNVPFNNSIPYNNIMGPGRLLEGFRDENMKPKIGANVKTSLSFELGTVKTHVTGFELGLLVDGYIGDVPLLVSTQNRSVFPTAFITLFYGTRK